MTKVWMPPLQRYPAFEVGRDHHHKLRYRMKSRRTFSRGMSIMLLFFACLVVSFLVSVVLLLALSNQDDDQHASEFQRENFPENSIHENQHFFPLHIENQTEEIDHPGFLLADAKRLAVIFQDSNIINPLKVPRFWEPPAPFGHRDGKVLDRVITRQEAESIGSTVQGKETIMVAIASYRDPQCTATAADIFERAKYPHRIRVAIVDQRVGTDPVCGQPSIPCTRDPDQSLCKYQHLIDYVEYDARLMVGPTFARHISNRMYRGEYFYLQVDAHVRFVANWDEDIIEQWKATGNEMAIISTYMTDISNSIDPDTHISKKNTRSIMCRAEYGWKGTSKEHIKFTSQPTNRPRILSSPMLHPFWAAGFSFARGHFVVQVPYDPFLPMVFQGEEISIGIRAFSYSYDSYAPSRNVAFHIYPKKDHITATKLFTENETLFPGAKDKAYKRLNGIIGIGTSTSFVTTDEGIYGLGRVRSKEQFFEMFGIHPESSTIDKGLCNFVLGSDSSPSMHETFSPYLRSDGMGIDYTEVQSSKRRR